ncbi:porin family protein [Chryseobacterium sp. HSC-36S06]|uniref:porin family protein n=1 Tax=Chryseobacterium sp. HSC-36S06 TaxID=2910970 RepID=UPI00209D9544|nr:porin family protein [Chryseobacterium sp. HSC-36S06]MCP2038081.1 opacity protein-like surface antigen [Chryseobacterium sp. HSC-36S06]
MKKLFLGAAIAMSSLTFAQQFGIKGGMNVSSLSSDSQLSDQGSKIGFNAGLFMNAPIAENFSIQPELLYSQMGDKYDQTIAGTTYARSRHLDYVTLPVMFQYNATPSFYLEAGPEFGLMVNAKNKFTNETDNNTITETGDYKDQLNTFNLGVGLGAGYYFTPNIGLTARYVAGFTDIYNSDNNGSDDSVKNNVFQVGLAYKF